MVNAVALSTFITTSRGSLTSGTIERKKERIFVSRHNAGMPDCADIVHLHHCTPGSDGADYSFIIPPEPTLLLTSVMTFVGKT